ncbi:MAG: TfoX family protein [Betaproteobacteria bacterium]|nr:TfoX family protein [Betaproteobacteria bacterium]
MSSDFAQYVVDLLAPHGHILVKRMFGGHGVYCDGLFIGILHAQTLYLKADDASRGEFERAGCSPFTYQRAGKAASLGFYAAPADAMESRGLITNWARLAMQAALRAKASKPLPRAKARN